MNPPVRAALHRVRLPLLTPHVAAHGTESVREVVLVALADEEGVTGWGECPTLATRGYTDETTDAAWDRLRGELVPAALSGREVDAAGGPMAAGAVRDALLDLHLRRSGEELAPPARTTVPFGVALNLVGAVADVVAAATRARDAGADLVVLKVRPGWTTAPLAAVRDAHPDLAVAVDANGSFRWPADEAELRALDAVGPAFVEQPLPAADLEGTAHVAAALVAPVALDEAVVTERDLAAAVSVEAGRVLTLKPARVGGYAAAVSLAERAHRAGWEVHVGGMLESGLGRAVARRLAGRPEVGGPALVGPTGLLFGADVVAAPVVAGPGGVPVPRGVGLAPPPDPEALAVLTVAHWTGEWRSGSLVSREAPERGSGGMSAG